VGYLSAVKFRLKGLLNSEQTPISEMSHDGEEAQRTIEDEGSVVHFYTLTAMHDTITFPFTFTLTVSCNVGDWFDVLDSVPKEEPVVIATSKAEGEI
jgi:hypothetical protein